MRLAPCGPGELPQLRQRSSDWTSPWAPVETPEGFEAEAAPSTGLSPTFRDSTMFVALMPPNRAGCPIVFTLPEQSSPGENGSLLAMAGAGTASRPAINPATAMWWRFMTSSFVDGQSCRVGIRSGALRGFRRPFGLLEQTSR